MLRTLSLVLALLVVIAVWRAAVAHPEPVRSNQTVGGVVDPSGEAWQATASRYGTRNDSPTSTRKMAPAREYLNTPFERSYDASQPVPPLTNRLVGRTVRPTDAPTFWNARLADESPHAQVQAKAFELDRLAHQLETDRNYEDADAIREAAQSLRSLARKLAEKARPTQAASLRATGSWPPDPVGKPTSTLQSPQPADPPRPEDE